ncbi:MAG: AAA family ATPase [Myxococcota bacterium]
MKSPRSLQQLVEHQMKRWEVEHRASYPRPGGAPCVALSRHAGSGGEMIAQQVAEWLDYGLFDKDIVEQVARERHVQRELVAGLDEKVADAIHRYVTDSFRSRAFSESDYLRGLIQVITTLGQRGMAVIVGRGAACILPPDRALRVLVTAPRAVRVERFAKEHSIPVSDATDRVDRIDSVRSEFARFQFGVDPDESTLYDLVINSEHLLGEAAARVIVEALRRRFPSEN